MGLFNLFKRKEQSSKQKKDKEEKKAQIKKNNEKVAARKGELGEYKIDIQLAQLPKEYKTISDLMVVNKKAKSGFSQIDHVIISPYGIFAIETKNYQGTIYGGKNRRTWLVNGKFRMMNPFIQNYGHLEALKKLVDSKFHDHFISMVSFTKRATFKLDELDLRKIHSNELIVYDVELSEYIHRKISVLKIHHKEPILSEQEINYLYETFKNSNIVDNSLRKEHIDVLKEGKKETQEKCNICNKPVSEKVANFCRSNKRFNGNIYCFEHQNSISN